MVSIRMALMGRPLHMQDDGRIEVGTGARMGPLIELRGGGSRLVKG
jgi:hypothetical protein